MWRRNMNELLIFAAYEPTMHIYCYIVHILKIMSAQNLVNIYGTFTIIYPSVCFKYVWNLSSIHSKLISVFALIIFLRHGSVQCSLTYALSPEHLIKVNYQTLYIFLYCTCMHYRSHKLKQWFVNNNFFFTSETQFTTSSAMKELPYV